MTSAVELLLGLECLQEDLAILRQEVDFTAKDMKSLKLLADTIIMILKSTTGKDSLEHLQMIEDGDMI